jgi:hypothetical protein
MTFKSFDEERDKIFQQDPFTRLLKCYDKVSNLLDASWMENEKWNKYSTYTIKLLNDAEKNYGTLNIIKIGKAISIQK